MSSTGGVGNFVESVPLRRGQATALLLAMAVMLAGCEAGGAGSRPAAGQRFSAKQADRFVMRESDFPPSYEKVGAQSGPVACNSGHLANRGALAETEPEVALRHQLLALGPQACNLSTYEITVGGGTTGFQALAVVFPDDDSASRALPLLRRSFVASSDFDAAAEAPRAQHSATRPSPESGGGCPSRRPTASSPYICGGLATCP